jgi:hypothetical protein
MVWLRYDLYEDPDVHLNPGFNPLPLTLRRIWLTPSAMADTHSSDTVSCGTTSCVTDSVNGTGRFGLDDFCDSHCDSIYSYLNLKLYNLNCVTLTL